MKTFIYSVFSCIVLIIGIESVHQRNMDLHDKIIPIAEIELDTISFYHGNKKIDSLVQVNDSLLNFQERNIGYIQPNLEKLKEKYESDH